jgi:hypothetical protein
MFDAAIYPVSDLRTNFREIEEKLKSKKVVYLTKNGRKEMLLIDPDQVDDVLDEWQIRRRLDAIEADPRSKAITHSNPFDAARKELRNVWTKI